MIGLCEWMSDGGVPLHELSGRDCSEVAGLISELTCTKLENQLYKFYNKVLKHCTISVNLVSAFKLYIYK